MPSDRNLGGGNDRPILPHPLELPTSSLVVTFLGTVVVGVFLSLRPRILLACLRGALARGKREPGQDLSGAAISVVLLCEGLSQAPSSSNSTGALAYLCTRTLLLRFPPIALSTRRLQATHNLVALRSAAVVEPAGTVDPTTSTDCSLDPFI